MITLFKITKFIFLILANLIKIFDSFPKHLLIAKSYSFGPDITPLKLLYSDFTNRKWVHFNKPLI